MGDPNDARRNLFNVLKFPSPAKVTPKKKTPRKSGSSQKQHPFSSPGGSADKRQSTLDKFWQKKPAESCVRRSLFDIKSDPVGDVSGVGNGLDAGVDSGNAQELDADPQHDAKTTASNVADAVVIQIQDDDDDDLIEVKFLRSSQKMLPTSDNDDKMNVINEALQDCHYKFSLESILLERAEQSEKDKILQQMELELMENEKAAEDADKEDAVSDLDFDEFIAPHDAKIVRPGIELFRSEGCFKLYRLPVPPRYDSDVSDTLGRILSQADADCFLTTIVCAHLDHYPKNLLNHPELLNYVYHVVTSHPDCETVYCCYKILSSVHDYLVGSADPTVAAWSPSFKDVITSLVNCGAIFSKLLPANSSFPFAEEDLNFVQEKDIAAYDATNIPARRTIPKNNLKHVVKVLSLFCEVPGAYTNEELKLVLLVCCGMMLHKNSASVFSMLEITHCITAALDLMDDLYWENNVGEIAYQILEFSPQHQNMLYLVKQMPRNTKRGLQLQKLASFIAVHILMGLDMEKQITAVEPMHVVTFYKDNLVRDQKDYHWLSSVIRLIEFAIGFEIDSTGYNKRILQKMVMLTKTTISRIRDRVQNPESTKVKNMIIRIATRWSLIALNMRLKQKTMFNYTSNSYRVEDLPVIPTDDAVDNAGHTMDEETEDEDKDKAVHRGAENQDV